MGPPGPVIGYNRLQPVVTRYFLTLIQVSPLKLNMSLYPHLSQPQYRRCGITTKVCPTFPCIHVPCQDPDYLADYEEFLANNQVHEKTWELYNSLYGRTPSYTLKEQLSVAEWAFYDPKVERCRRLEGKKEQIRQERKAHEIRARIQYRMEEEELFNDESLKDHPFIIRRKEDRRRGNLP